MFFDDPGSPLTVLPSLPGNGFDEYLDIVG